MDSSGQVQKIRAFIAVHPDALTLARLQELQQALRTEFKNGIRWAKPEQLHLTLQFLGYIPVPQVSEYQQAVQKVSQRHRPFQMCAEGIGCFPSLKRPRVIWAGLHGDVEVLQRIKSQLDDELKPLGYVPENRPFHPHITFGRVEELSRSDHALIQKRVEDATGKPLGEWTVQAIDLMQSVLSSKGPTYHVLHAAPLGG